MKIERSSLAEERALLTRLKSIYVERALHIRERIKKIDEELNGKENSIIN